MEDGEINEWRTGSGLMSGVTGAILGGLVSNDASPAWSIALVGLLFGVSFVLLGLSLLRVRPFKRVAPNPEPKAAVDLRSFMREWEERDYKQAVVRNAAAHSLDPRPAPPPPPPPEPPTIDVDVRQDAAHVDLYIRNEAARADFDAYITAIVGDGFAVPPIHNTKVVWRDGIAMKSIPKGIEEPLRVCSVGSTDPGPGAPDEGPGSTPDPTITIYPAAGSPVDWMLGPHGDKFRFNITCEVHRVAPESVDRINVVVTMMWGRARGWVVLDAQANAVLDADPEPATPEEPNMTLPDDAMWPSEVVDRQHTVQLTIRRPESDDGKLVLLHIDRVRPGDDPKRYTHRLTNPWMGQLGDAIGLNTDTASVDFPSQFHEGAYLLPLPSGSYEYFWIAQYGSFPKSDFAIVATGTFSR